MRVLFVSWRELAHPQAGGSELVVDRLARGLATRGHEVALMCGGPVAPRGYPVIDLGGTYAQYLTAPVAYRRRFRDVDVVVDVENGVPFFTPLWRRGPIVCLVHHVHTEQWGMRFPGPLAAVGRTLEGRVMPRVYRRRLFVAVSPSTAGAVADLGVAPEQIRRVRWGVDPEAAPAGDDDDPLFLVLGRLVAHKGVDRVLDAWERVRPRVGGRLLVVGEGPERSRLQARAGPGVEFLGHVDAAVKRELLGRAWLLLHGAHHEGWGVVVMEAAMARTPTLGYDVPGVRDAVVAGVTGELVTSDDELAHRWVALAEDTERRAGLADRARRRALGFTWERSIDDMESALREAVGSRRLPMGAERAA